jgi:hypothetical protein
MPIDTPKTSDKKLVPAEFRGTYVAQARKCKFEQCEDVITHDYMKKLTQVKKDQKRVDGEWTCLL